MKLPNIAACMTLVLAIFTGQLHAQTYKKDFTYEDVENAILDVDLQRMTYYVQRINEILADSSDFDSTTELSLNEALGMLHMYLGEKDRSHEAFTRCMDLIETHFSGSNELRHRILFGLLATTSNPILDMADHMEYLTDDTYTYYSYFNLGFFLGFFQSNDTESAIKTLKKAMDLCYSETGKRWARAVCSTICGQLSDTYMTGGEYDLALESFDDVQRKVGSLAESRYFHLMSEKRKSRIYLQLGNLPKAKESAAAARKLLMEKNPAATMVGAEISKLQGEIAYLEGDFQTAYERFIETKDVYGRFGQDTLPLMIKEMSTLFKLRRTEEAESLSDYIEELLEERDDILYTSEYLYEFGNILIELKYSTLAIDALTTGLKIKELVGNYDDILKMKNSLGEAYINAGEYHNAIKLYEDIVQTEKKRAHDIFAFLPERQREMYWKSKEPLMQNIFKLNQEGTVTATYGSVFETKKNNKSLCSSVLYDASLLNKGLLLEAFLNMQRKILTSGNNELIKAFTELRELNGRDPEKAEMLEETIISQLDSYGDFMDFTRIGWQDIRNNLKADEAAIEFVVSEGNGMTYYSAEVLRNDYDQPQHVFLFAQKKEDASLGRMDVYSRNSLYKKIWGKLEKYFEGCSDIYFAPVGEFYRVGIEYLPVNDSTRINDRFRMHRLSSTKSIARRNEVHNTSLSSAALYGGLDYNLDSESMEYYAYTMQESLSRGTAVNLHNTKNLKDMQWGYLRGTEEEVTNISGILESLDCSTSLYTGGEGVEESFKKINGNSPEVIHIATHGFILEPCDDISISTGLVFAGANNYGKTGKPAVEGIDDGLLTSKEIAEMNLDGAELVVLSACQTGAGQISGEGVFGLQRGFKKACAQTLLMSLWEVDDHATNELMTRFYMCLAEGMDRHTALHNAQNHVKATCGTDPELWAGFILLD